MVELTTRTIQGRYLLRPSGMLNQITIGILARAQKLTGAEVHAASYLSNHGQHAASFLDVGRTRLNNAFLALYREAAEKLKEGDLTADFPVGCFPPGQPFRHPKLVPD